MWTKSVPSIPSRIFDLLLFTAATLLLAVAQTTGAQVTTSDILGTVRDTSGAMIPGAKVTLTLVDRQQVRTTVTNGTGEYTFAQLQNGTYAIAVEAAGYVRYELKSFMINGGDRRRVDAALSVAGTVQQVDVSAAQPALDADTSALSTVVNQRQVEDLPLNGRNFVQLAQLAAGSNEGTPSAISNGNRPDDRRQTSSVVANAQSDTLNNEMVEGVDNNEGTVGTIVCGHP